MKRLLFVIAAFNILQNAKAQVGPIELMAGDKYLHYQHSLGQSLKPESKFGWQHIATFIKRYKVNADKGGMSDELMNQGYMTYRLNSLITLKGGLFYTNVGGYQPTLGVQFFWYNKDWVVIAAPRIDIIKNGTYEMFSMVEFSSSIGRSMKLYTRLQAMSNVGNAGHNRSYQLLRVGVELKGFQVGGGITLDEYGSSGKVYYNSGIFVRKML